MEVNQVSNKGFIGNNDIALIHKGKIISDVKQLTKLFNSYTFGINFESTSVQSVRDIASSYENHPSIIKIKEVVYGSDVSDTKNVSFKTVDKTEIKNLLRNLDIKKVSGIDTMSPKMVKLSVEFLTPSLTKAINTSVTQNIFPENAETASVIPLYKDKTNKNKMSNFRTVSMLNTFPKVYESVIKDQIICGMEKYFSPF